MSGSLHQIDVCIYGGGLGGIAAALVLLEQGKRVVLVEPSAWIGGQMTSQGVSALDEHTYIEQHPGTHSYGELRRAIRQLSAHVHGITISDSFNPGNGWVSRLCFEPKIALAVLEEWLRPWVTTGMCIVYHSTVVHAAHRTERTIHSVTFLHANGSLTTCGAAFFVDASELGDILDVAGLATITGAESHQNTYEALAPEHARPDEVQGFTYSFAVSYVPNSHNVIAKPEGYASLRDTQPFSLVLLSSDGTPRPFRVFEEGPTGLPPFWTYRRIWDGQQSDPHTADIALINWNSNDYHRRSLIGATARESASIVDEAKRLSLAFLYYLQTEVPRDDGNGYGYPELRLMPDVMGTPDGLSMAPYIRESRRTHGLVRITADDILASANPQARARHWHDSIGIGWYPMDLHPAVGNEKSLYEPTRPFQIPLGALIPPDCDNLVCANKNIATTHLSNGAYRLHPVEWSIGTGAGMAVTVAMEHGVTLPSLHADTTKLAEVQIRLLRAGNAVAWAVDVLPEDPIFVPTQMLILYGVIANDSARGESVDVAPDECLTTDEYTRFLALLKTTTGERTPIPYPLRWRDACALIAR